MEVPKIHLSDPEIKLMCDADIILTKNVVLQKMKLLFENVQELQLNYIKEKTLNYKEIFQTAPKISRGENYEGLPYLILDFPRHSTKENFLFIRTFFWWGNFFSSTLHSAGTSKSLILDQIEKKKEILANKDFYIALSDDPWRHHFRSSNFQHIQFIKKEIWENEIKNQDYIKLAAKWPVSCYNEVAAHLFTSWKFLLEFCINSPSDEIDL